MVRTRLILCAFLLPCGGFTRSADCNGNGIDDAVDLAAKALDLRKTPSYPSLASPGSIHRYLASADLNGDGKLDIVNLSSPRAGDDFNERVSVLVNQGDGTFRAGGDYDVEYPGSVAALDLNHDGSPDLWGYTGANEDTKVFILFNDGAGAFAGPTLLVMPGAPPGIQPFFVDLNGDGEPDLIGLDPDLLGDHAFVSLGTGGLQFQEAASYPTPIYSEGLNIADLNGDGRPDLVTTSLDSSYFFVIINRGDGTFLDRVVYRMGPDLRTAAIKTVEIADVDGDGLPDIVVGTYAFGTASVLRNQGHGTFEDARITALGTAFGFMALGDLDGDGKPELLTSDSRNIIVHHGQGDGTFGATAQYRNLGGFLPLFSIADLNGDGSPDIAAPNYESDAITLFLNQGDGSFGPPASYATGRKPSFMQVEDFDGDGKPDLATGARPGGVNVLLNHGDGSFQGAPSFPFGTEPLLQPHGPIPRFLAVADFDGDGQPDLAIVEKFLGGISVLRNLGDGRLAEVSSASVGNPLGAPVAADVDGDGKPDLVLAQEDDIVSVYRNRGDDAFEAGVNHLAGRHPVSLVVADLDGDGKLDLAVANQDSGSVSVFRNRGDGTYGDGVTYPVGGQPVSLVVADWNGDGRPDLATGDADHEQVHLLLNRGDGSFRDLPSPTPGVHPGALTVADFDGDGEPDLAIEGASGGTDGSIVSVFRNRGDGAFRSMLSVDGGQHRTGLRVADLNQDGAPDLVVASRQMCAGGACEGLDEVTVILNRDRGEFEPAVKYPLLAAPLSLIVADLDGDGDLDLLSGDDDTGSASALLNRGDGRFGDEVRFSPGGGSMAAVDIDGDRRLDLAVLRESSVAILRNLTPAPVSVDLNHNGLPDECETRFRRGDADGDARLNITDAVVVLRFLFRGQAVLCEKALDTSDDGRLDISDAVVLFGFLFQGGKPPREPFRSCGLEPTSSDLTCRSFAACQ